ncbi:MAG: tRNA-dihydrouridine synthase family protein [Clostridia bacterium]
MSVTDLLTSNVILAPLAGYTDAPFRFLAHKYGAGLTTTEMVSAKALSLNPKNIAHELLYCLDGSGVKCVQLFGSEVEVFRQVASSELLSSFDIIDINMGCPVRKIVSNGEGSALINNFLLASQIIKAVKSSGKYVSVKFRLGITDNSRCVDFAKNCVDSGADMLTVHGRTQKQMYSGKADWDSIGKICNAVDAPVFGNGDVSTRQDYLTLQGLGCYGVAVGRGALGRPYIFSQILNIPYQYDIYSTINFHIDKLKELLPDKVVANEMKKHVFHYIKGITGNKQVVTKIMQFEDTQSIKNALYSFLFPIV